MDAADLVLLVGNQTTLSSFPDRWHSKIRCLNYSVDTALYAARRHVSRKNEFCYVATECGLRKGFMDVVRTWRDIGGLDTRLHAVGALAETLGTTFERVQPREYDLSRLDRLAQRRIRAASPSPVDSRLSRPMRKGRWAACWKRFTAAAFPSPLANPASMNGCVEHCVVVEPLHIEQQRGGRFTRLAVDRAGVRCPTGTPVAGRSHISDVGRIPPWGIHRISRIGLFYCNPSAPMRLYIEGCFALVASS